MAKNAKDQGIAPPGWRPKLGDQVLVQSIQPSRDPLNGCEMAKVVGIGGNFVLLEAWKILVPERGETVRSYRELREISPAPDLVKV